LEKIIVNTPGKNSSILVGEKWQNVKELLPEKGVVIITDENVSNLYGKNFPEFPVFSIKPGEQSKNLGVVEILAEKLLNTGLDRSGMILAIGGGVVCDIAGFLASIFMRGIRCSYVSTTLLSQVDASTGGKNGVDLGGAKNILGCFRQPDFVICDPSMLLTLSNEEYLSGLAELIKTAIIGDKDLFSLIESHYAEIMNRDPVLLENLIARSVRFKAAIVTEDEEERGIRKILNFGHTFGHAIEMHRSVRHGFAVAEGMVLATIFSFEQKMIDSTEKSRILELIRKYGFEIPDSIPAEIVEKLVRLDKKKTDGEISFVFSGGIGNAVCKKIPLTDVMKFYKRHIGLA
jgi:3-dehydroquinate synthase